ncbi:hypothetical protein ACFXKI_39595 [Streptomyces mirabilis]|uniref:hypothetical protein n=1 Tax=Streptomyces mirabilis TaxID=68239 RepID=UPI0036A3D72B
MIINYTGERTDPVFDRHDLSEGSMAELLTAQPIEDGRQTPPQSETHQLDQ